MNQSAEAAIQAKTILNFTRLSRLTGSQWRRRLYLPHEFAAESCSSPVDMKWTWVISA